MLELECLTIIVGIIGRACQAYTDGLTKNQLQAQYMGVETTQRYVTACDDRL
ncbi:MAG: hypothetical protein IT427_19205 [Pirellulales bacterium]|nr:hypothetical protein [Pirellulales bacterium]